MTIHGYYQEHIILHYYDNTTHTHSIQLLIIIKGLGDLGHVIIGIWGTWDRLLLVFGGRPLYFINKLNVST